MENTEEYPTTENRGKERLELNIGQQLQSSLPYHNFCVCGSLLFFFYSCLVSVMFTSPFPHGVHFTANRLTLVYVSVLLLCSNPVAVYQCLLVCKAYQEVQQ